MNKKIRTTGVVFAAAAVIGVGIWLGATHYGKWTGNPGSMQKRADGPMERTVNAYNAGKFKEAEAAAEKIIEQNKNSTDVKKREEAVHARYITAFAAARQKNMKVARERFGLLQIEASRLPDKGKRNPLPGQMQPTLGEEAAYQHAVCTAALGDKEAAEAEYMKLMADYPESPLVTAAAKRIEMLHNGKMPAAADAAWEKAHDIAQSRRDKELRTKLKQESMCGPECLAEIIRRQGGAADVDALAKEMETREIGTSLLALADTAKKHRIAAKGYRLTQTGLAKQQMPVIVLIAPGHYVIVERVTSKEVTVWDPYGEGVGKPATRKYPIDNWSNVWRGVTLVMGQIKK